MGIFTSIREKIKKHRQTMKSVSQNDVIAIALEGGGKLTPGVLAARTVLSVGQARMKLTALNTQGIFRIKYDYKKHDYNGNSYLYILKHPELYQNLSFVAPTQPAQQQTNTTQKKLSDASVIHAALKSKGRITAGVLCIRADITIDEARKKLQELQHKGVFDIEATSNGALVYVLNELETFNDLMHDELAEEELT